MSVENNTVFEPRANEIYNNCVHNKNCAFRTPRSYAHGTTITVGILSCPQYMREENVSEIH